MVGVDLVDPAMSKFFAAVAVVVIYRKSLREATAVETLLEARKNVAAAGGTVRMLVWDNSPTAQSRDRLPEDVLYFHDPRNLGLANAYNRALEIAIECGAEWLITLDQDTSLPADYFVKMIRSAQCSGTHPGLGAIVPQIEEDKILLSPNRFLFGALPSWYRRGYTGIPVESVYAFNSGAMIRVDALRQVGGYDPRFPLDHCDAQIFRKLHLHGKKVYIAGNIRIQHNFSMKNLKCRMSSQRYRQSLLSESAFWDENMNWLAGCERTLRLMLRCVKHWIHRDPHEMRLITQQAIAMRIFVKKRDRLENWRRAAGDNTGGAIVSSAYQRERARVSVCMAAYNGARYIKTQLTSILSQLDRTDELIIVDDHSSDSTVEVILQLGDPRVRLYRHDTNKGVVITFEEALLRATGDILFLCDDDDVWAPQKVDRFLEAFARDPSAQLVISRVRVIDEFGIEYSDERLGRGGKAAPGFWQNIFANHYQGSAMAIRASFLGSIVPFPRKKAFLHDVWIGTRNDLLGGKTVYLNEELLLYRRHSTNATRAKSLSQKFRTRWDLLLAHALYALRSAAS